MTTINRIEEIECFFRWAPVPSIADGPHREQLKRRLLESARSMQLDATKTRVSLLGRMSPLMKLAAALLAAAILAATAWAAEIIYRKFTEFSLVLERSPVETWELPDGKKMTSGEAIFGSISSDEPNAVTTAQQRHEEMKQLIADKKYEFVKTFDASGQKQYVYAFTHADGSRTNMNFSMPLENVTSWDDYQRKQQEQQQQRRLEINKAIAAGSFQLINVETILVHICREADSNQKYRVQRIVLPNGKEIALYRPYEIEAEQRAATMPQSSWQDHMQAISDGKWELLSVETTPSYTYEIVLQDGTKTLFHYGGGEPLKKPESK